MEMGVDIEVGKGIQSIKEMVDYRTNSSCAKLGQEDEYESGCIRLCNRESIIYGV